MIFVCRCVCLIKKIRFYIIIYTLCCMCEHPEQCLDLWCISADKSQLNSHTLFRHGARCVLRYLALWSSHLGEQGLGNFGPLHLLLNLIIDGGVDVEDAALRLAVPLARQRWWFHLLKERTFKKSLQVHKFFLVFERFWLCEWME